jgi:hypothetical protein
MNDGPNARQQIVEKIKSSSNILVTVSADPSVDQLSSALGLTIILNAMKKHATAVVSGAIPPAIDFLEPGKTFENTVDSLRDFIIALDKEKADHLRYKVDGEVVKIFITPYRTTINESDLDFSQGDYNVELVLALGVKDKDHLDKALLAHGRILHDATVATMSAGDQVSNLGSIDWVDGNASSLAEMLVALTEALKGDKPVLDEQSATALLTGIVAATDRFSNNKTSSKVMTMAAQLMAAGANQQLIAARLEEAHEIGPEKENQDTSGSSNSDGSTDMNEGESTKLEPTENKTKKADDGSLAINHEKQGDLEDVAHQTAAEDQAEATQTAEQELEEQLSNTVGAANTPSVSDLQKDLAAASEEVDKAAEAPVGSDSVLPPVVPDAQDEPSLGGTLNATAEQAHEDAEAERDKDRNKTILNHSSGRLDNESQPSFQSPFNAVSQTAEEPKSVDVFSNAAPTVPAPDVAAPGGQAVQELESTPPTETLADLDKKNRKEEHAEAQAAVAAALDSAPFNPANQPEVSVGAQPLGDMLHYEETPLPTPPAPASVNLPPLPPVEPAPAPATPAAPVDFSVLPPPPPIPDVAPQGPLPPEQLGQMFQSPPAPAPEAPQPNDPNQFKIPGQ